MRKFPLSLAMIGAAVAVSIGTTPVHAQATRTWVSGVGDDANPCSRTAPCKTFAGAILKTTVAGEINCIDSGDFGAVTITKALTINCESVIAGILVSGTNGITVNAPGSVVVLKGLDIEGSEPGWRASISLQLRQSRSTIAQFVISTPARAMAGASGLRRPQRPKLT